MPLSGFGPRSRPIAWALLSLSIWLPLLGIDLHDRWHAQRRHLPPGGSASAALLPGHPPATGPMRWAQPSAAAASAAGVAAPPLSLAELRHALGPSPAATAAPAPAAATASLLRRGRIGQMPIPATGLLLSSAGPAPLASPPRSGGGGAPPAAIPAVRPAGPRVALATTTANTTVATTADTAAASPAAGGAAALASQQRSEPAPPGLRLPPRAGAPSGALAAAPLPLSRLFRGSQLLGGALGLEDLQEGPMSALALVERARRSGSPDPLAPLPPPWREPLRQALLRLPNAPARLATARLVTLPSSRVRQPSELPLALQSDGSVDILEAPADPALLIEVERWSRRQPRPAPGSQAPALLRFQPLNEAAAAAPPAARATPAAAASARRRRPSLAEAQRAGSPAAATVQAAGFQGAAAASF
jgi:hypothetical protein